MKNLTLLGAIALALLNGCTYYEGGYHPDMDDPGWGDDWDDWGDEFSDDGDDDGADQDDWTCTPNFAEPGETIIVEVTPNNGQDVDECTDVSVFGDCGLMAFEIQDDSILLVVTMDADADEACDVLLDFGGEADFIDDAIHPGSAEVCDDPPDDQGSGDDGGSGDGGGSGNDGSGDDGGDPFDECP